MAILLEICKEDMPVYKYSGKCKRFKDLMFYCAETIHGEERYFSKDLSGHGGSQLKGYKATRRKLLFDGSYCTFLNEDGRKSFEKMTKKHESKDGTEIKMADLKQVIAKKTESRE